MKRLVSKKSGFSLVEIIVAFAVFAIMSTLVVQTLNLTIQRRAENAKVEQYMQGQNETIIARPREGYDHSGSSDGTLNFAFKNEAGTDLSMDLDYQMRSADGTAGDPSGLNYFVSVYEEGNGGVIGGGLGGGAGAAGGGTQMSRFDTRITGTKGIDSVKISFTPNGDKTEYTVTVTVYDSGVDSIMKSHSQVSLFFGENVSGGAMGTIVSLMDSSGNVITGDNLKYIKKAGPNGVNVHCTGTGFNGSSATFRVKFAAPISDLGFGSNGSGNTYTMYPGYPNIFGAYELATAEATPEA